MTEVVSFVVIKRREMKTRILDFFISQHSMLRQWERGIDEDLLKCALSKVTPSTKSKKVAICIPSFVNRCQKSTYKGFLVMILKRQLLKTAFWCSDPNYLFEKESNADFQIISSCTS